MVDSFDPAKKATNAVLSNGNLTLTTAPTAYSGALTVVPTSSGKLYAELTLNVSGGFPNNFSFGVGDVSSNLTTAAGALDAHSVGYLSGNNSFYFSGVQTGGILGTITTGSVIAIAVDFANKEVWLRGPSGLWNADATADPATNTHGLHNLHYNLTALLSGTVYLMAAAYQGSQVTINLGATAFAGVIPSGFSAWAGAGAPPVELTGNLGGVSSYG